MRGATVSLLESADSLVLSLRVLWLHGGSLSVGTRRFCSVSRAKEFAIMALLWVLPGTQGLLPGGTSFHSHSSAHGFPTSWLVWSLPRHCPGVVFPPGELILPEAKAEGNGYPRHFHGPIECGGSLSIPGPHIPWAQGHISSHIVTSDPLSLQWGVP